MIETWGDKLASWADKAKMLLRRAATSIAKVLGIPRQRQSRQERALRRRMRSVANVVAMAALESSEPDKLIMRALREILRGSDMDAGMVYLREEDDERITLVCRHALPEELVDEAASIFPGKGALQDIFETKEALAIPDLRALTPGVGEKWIGWGYRSLLGIPVACGERILGAIVLLSARSQTFSEAAVDAFEFVGSTVGKSLEKAWADNEIRNALVSARRLNRANFEPGPVFKLNEALEKLSQAVCEGALALSSIIVLVDDQGGVVRRATVGYGRQALSAAASRMDAISLRVSQTREPVVIEQPEGIGDSIGPRLVEAGVESAVCLPLRAGDDTPGALWLNYETPRKFAAWELHQLQDLADRVAVAIENSQAYAALAEEVERYKTFREHCERMSSSTEPKEVLQKLADSARELSEAGTAVACFSSEGVHEQAISAAADRHAEESKEACGVTTAVLRAVRAALENHGATQPEESASGHASPGPPGAGFRMKGSLTIPLVDEDEKAAGLLVVSDKMDQAEFSQEDAKLLEALVKHAMLAIRSAKIYKQGERSVREYRALLDGLAIAVVRVNREKTITSVNRRFEELTGFSKEDVENKMPLWDILPETEREENGAFWEGKAEVFGGQQESEALLVTKDRGRKRVKVSVTAVQNSGSIALCLREVSEEVALKQVAGQTERLAASILDSLFLPAATAIDRLEGLLERQVNEETQQSLHELFQEIRAGSRRLEEFHVLTEPRPLVKQPVKINELITEIIDEKAAELRRDGVVVVLRLDANLPPVDADAEQLSWVLERLVENSRHALRETDALRSLTLRTERKGRIGRIAISDTRTGVSPEKLERLFQLPTEEKEIAREVDLSLAACRAVIERQDWVVTAESPPDGGLLFVIEHPVAEEMDEETHAESSVQLVESLPSDSPAKPAAKNILIVDDEAVVIELLDYYLRSEGHLVETSRDGRDALKKLKERDYDLIFCDLKMPGLTGQELFQWLEANKPEMARRIIFITGDVATPATMAFLKKPQKRWLEKPFDLTELRQVIGEVLR